MRQALTVLAVVFVSSGCGGSGSTTTLVTTSVTTVTPAPPAHRSFAQLVRQVRSGVIRIESQFCGNQGAVGTGFLISPNLVATVDHVVAGAQAITLKRGTTVLGTGTVLGGDQARDVALVQTSVPINGYVFSIAAARPRLGQAVAALGFPFGYPLTLTRGSVSGLNRTLEIDGIVRNSLIQTDTAINFGNSGGPLFTAGSGKVLGLVDAEDVKAHGEAWAVSGLVAAPLISAWQTSPQPVAAASCSQGPGSTPSTVSYHGSYFSIHYPTGWQIVDSEKNLGGYLDTTIENSTDTHVLLRVDMTPHASASVTAHAQALESALAAQPGYHRLQWHATTIDGHSGWYWEFTDTEAGVAFRKTDVFFNDSTGNSFAILFQAPASEWAAYAPLFTTLNQTLSTP
jgi:hypothetical protein